MCDSCVRNLTSAFDFKKKCEQTDEVLRKLFAFYHMKAEPNIVIKQEPDEIKIEHEYQDNFQNNDDDDDDFQASDYEPLGKKEVFKVKKKKKKLSEKGHHPCSMCHKVFLKASKLERHVKSHLKETNKDHPCDVCARVFDRASKLERHIKIHNPELKPFGCVHCGKRFKRETLLLSHLITHPTAVTHPPTEAGEGDGVGEMETSRESMKLECVEQQERHSCAQCDMVFETMHSLSAHMRKHRVKNRVLSCHICGKVILTISSLSRLVYLE